MATKTMDRIIKTLNEIPEIHHKMLYDLIKDFKKKAGKTKGNGKWSRYAGIITDDEAKTMMAAIDNAFEKVEEDD